MICLCRALNILGNLDEFRKYNLKDKYICRYIPLKKENQKNIVNYNVCMAHGIVEWDGLLV